MCQKMRTKLNIEGMTCGHCVSAVKRAIETLPGVTGAEVNLAEGWATIDGATDIQGLIAAVEEEGYAARLA